MDLVFATHNLNKSQEIAAMAGEKFNIRNLKDMDCHTEIPETSDTLVGNALQKAHFVLEHYHCDCFADDTGLEVEALDGRPGVYSARYAGEHCSYQDNVNKLLREMKGKSNRKACFKTVIALIVNGEEHIFEGRIDGIIIEEARGEKGFGYDPVFVPNGFDKSFAEMSDEEKNKISHRGQAFQKMLNYLIANYKSII